MSAKSRPHKIQSLLTKLGINEQAVNFQGSTTMHGSDDHPGQVHVNHHPTASQDKTLETLEKLQLQLDSLAFKFSRLQEYLGDLSKKIIVNNDSHVAPSDLESRLQFLEDGRSVGQVQLRRILIDLQGIMTGEVDEEEEEDGGENGNQKDSEVVEDAEKDDAFHDAVAAYDGGAFESDS